ncbi:MAG TPA: S26 family signal peptidase [Candidatus Acidoferrum sp.]|nr:S26 family signal peptidase [Candidatus Acidoferrum sp.]
MAQVTRQDQASSYYPPRSRWYTRLLYGSVGPVSRSLRLPKLVSSSNLPGWHLLLSVALPGFIFFVLGRERLGRAVVGIYLAAAAVFLVALGFTVANLAFGVLVSLHAISIVAMEWLWLKESNGFTKVFAALATLFAVWGLMYTPPINFAEHHWFMPLRQGGHVYVIQRVAAKRSIKRGDWLAYRITGDLYRGEHYGGLYLESGFGLERVLALPGDRVRFAREAVYVNDQPFPLAPYMPTEGELVVPQKVWFIWPRFGMNMDGGGRQAGITATMQRTAMVTQEQIIGRPFKRWFGRPQRP